MALRLIEMVLEAKECEKLPDLLKECKILEQREIPLSNSEVLVRILLEAEQSESVLDLLQGTCSEKNRMVILPVEATLPREAEPLDKNQVLPDRIDREELYESIKNAARCSRTYLMMTILSTIVAAVGLYHNSVTIIIGAMVIAPLLGPNIAFALGTTLGDLPLLRRALLAALVGITATIVLSVLFGIWINLNPEETEVIARTQVRLGDFAVALASGCAGALAFTTGVSAILIGVMVAVALLPPLVTFGLLLGSGLPTLALNAWALFVMNLICINLAAVVTFLVQGIHPATWWEKTRATKATRVAITLWVLLLAALAVMVLLLRGNST